MMPGTMELTTQQYEALEIKECMHVLGAFAATARRGGSPAAYYEAQWGRSPLASAVTRAFERASDLSTKAAVLPGSTTNPDYVALVTEKVTTAFLGQVRKASILGQLPLTVVPFGTRMVRQTSGSLVAWVGEGMQKPVTKFGLTSVPVLAPLKAAAIVVATSELLEFAAAGSEQALNQMLRNELVAFIDASFLSATAATAIRPAGVLAGVTASADAAAAVAALFTARPQARSPLWVASAASISKLTLDTRGYLRNFPIVESPEAGPNVILGDWSAVGLGDTGGALSVSDQALLQMRDDPVPPDATTAFTSLWQDDLTAVRAERTINWRVVEPGSVQFFVPA